MNRIVKELQKKGADKLAQQVVKAADVADDYKKSKKDIIDIISNIERRLSMHSNLFKKTGSSDEKYVNDLELLKISLTKASKFANSISKP